MNGIRVSNIPNQLSERLLKKYFTDPKNGGGSIKEVFYPLINNDAVIIFEEGLTVVTALTKKNPENSSFILAPLPHEVFSRVECQLEPGLSDFVIATGEYVKMFQQWGLEVRKKAGSCCLAGTWYKIEWAWNYLGQIMEKQAAIQQRQVRSRQEDSDVSTEVSDREVSPRESRTTNGAVRTVENGVGASSSNSQSRSSKINGAITKEKLFKRERQEKYREQEYDTDPGYMRTSDDDSDVGVISRQETSSRRPVDRELPGSATEKSAGFLESGNLATMSMTSSLGEETIGATGQHSRARDADSTFNHFTSLQGHGIERDIGQDRSSQGRSQGQDMVRDLGEGHGDMVQGQRSPDSARERPSSARSSHQASGGATYRVDSPRSTRGSTRGADATDDDVSDADTLQGRSLTSSHSNTPGGRWRSDQPSTSSTTRGTREASSRYSHPYGVEDDVPDGYSSQSLDIGDLKIKIYLSDITKATAEAIVNCANSELMHSSGVARAIARAAGERMEDECAQYIRDHSYLETTEVMHTSSGGQLKKYKYILHTVGPIYIGSSNRDKCLFDLTKTFLNCLWYADDKLSLNSLALPFISTGVYSTPLEDCVASFIDAVLIFLEKKKKKKTMLKEIHLVNNDINVVSMAITLLQSIIYDADLEQMSKEAVAKYDLKSTPKDDIFSGLHSGARPKSSGSGNLRRTNSVDMLTHQRQEQREGSAAALMTSSYSGTLDRAHGFGTTGSTSSGYRQRSSSFSLRDPGGSDKDLGYPGSPKISNSMDFTPSRIRGHQTSNKASYPRRDESSIPTSFKKKQSEARSTTRSSKSPMKAMVPSGRDVGAVGYQSSTIDRLNRSFDRMSLSQEVHPFQSLPVDMKKHTSHDSNCTICLDKITCPKTLQKCGHTFCENCIRKSLVQKPVCPICGEVYGTIIGNQPKGGKMIHKIIVSHKLEGYKHSDGVLEITYSFNDGIQDETHPNPGRPYAGIRRRAYLPNNKEGQDVLQLLYKAFDARLIFTIGDSCTTGEKGVITWNDIHHKTSMTGGPTQHGYPDPSYLSRVQEELATKGITK